MKNELTTVNTSLVLSDEQYNILDTIKAEDLSLGEVDSSTFAIPYLSLVQALSPVITDGINENAKVGMFYNTVSKEVYNSVEIIPCYFQRRYSRFDAQRNFKGMYQVSEIEGLKIQGVQRTEDGLNYTIDGDRLVDTRIHYALVKGEGQDNYEPCIINLSSTQIKQSRNLMCMLRNMEITKRDGTKIKPPSFLCNFKVTSFTEKNDLGSWKSWSFTFKDFVNDNFTFQKAKAFYESVKNDVIKAENAVYDYVEPTSEIKKEPQSKQFGGADFVNDDELMF